MKWDLGEGLAKTNGVVTSCAFFGVGRPCRGPMREEIFCERREEGVWEDLQPILVGDMLGPTKANFARQV